MGEIVGILKQMKETFESNMSKATADEKKAEETFAQLKSADARTSSEGLPFLHGYRFVGILTVDASRLRLRPYAALCIFKRLRARGSQHTLGNYPETFVRYALWAENKKYKHI